MGSIYYLAFGYSDRWYDKWLRGYTHVALIAKYETLYIAMQPVHKCCYLMIGASVKFENWPAMLKVRVTPTKANRLIGLRFQTCATFVQYIMGISTGALLCQTLYERLLNREYEGVEVSICDLKTQS